MSKGIFVIGRFDNPLYILQPGGLLAQGVRGLISAGCKAGALPDKIR
jgi:hypothetical protein